LSTSLLLVANDQHLGRVVNSHVELSMGQPALLRSFETIRGQLDPDVGGLLLAAASAADWEQVVRLVQEIRLQHCRPIILLLTREAAALEKDVGCLDPYITARLRWPEQTADLLDLVRHFLSRGPSCNGGDQESLQELIGRRLVSQTPSLMPLVEPLALAASHDVTVSLTGETGTGKTYLARLIHECSSRKGHRLLVVPCGSLAANLIESEFFGHTKGAFTSADRPKIGKFEAAGEGTLLLDEIDALGLEQQSSLLRVIETGEYEPVGSNKTQLCRARILVASNSNLEEAVVRGTFREDLFYRLNVMSFHLPPLRERMQDIAPLAWGMVARFNTKFRKNVQHISLEVLAALEAFPWPGNIRQLENVIQQAVLICPGPQLLPQHLPKPVREHTAPEDDNGVQAGDLLAHNRQSFERTVILRTLVNCSYHRARAATALGISRQTLYKKMKKYGLMETLTEDVDWAVDRRRRLARVDRHAALPNCRPVRAPGRRLPTASRLTAEARTSGRMISPPPTRPRRSTRSRILRQNDLPAGSPSRGWSAAPAGTASLPRVPQRIRAEVNHLAGWCRIPTRRAREGSTGPSPAGRVWLFTAATGRGSLRRVASLAANLGNRGLLASRATFLPRSSSNQRPAPSHSRPPASVRESPPARRLVESLATRAFLPARGGRHPAPRPRMTPAGQLGNPGL
jgi:DNA-binding NtrC family response regulator